MSSILLVEDEDSLAIGLRDVLVTQGYTVLRERDGEGALKRLSSGEFDLVILDVELPGLSGVEVLKQLRSQSSGQRVLMLTARSSELDRVLGFELGADDYVTKPFSLAELLGRIKTLLRRSLLSGEEPKTQSDGLLRLGQASIDLARFKIDRQGTELSALPTKLFSVLEVLYARQGQVVTRDDLIDAVWGQEECITHRTLNNLVVKIRQAIEEDPDCPQHLLTVHGVGYRLEVHPKDVTKK